MDSQTIQTTAGIKVIIFILVTFPVEIKYSDKIDLEEKESPSWQRSQDSKGLRMLLTPHPQSGSRKWWVVLSFSYAVQNVLPFFSMILPTYNLIITVLYKHAQQLNTPSYVCLEACPQEIPKHLRLTASNCHDY